MLVSLLQKSSRPMMSMQKTLPKFLSTMARTTSAAVHIDRFTPSSTTSTTTHYDQRLPNEVNQRNALYQDEAARTLGDVTASVRHDWTKDEIAAIYSLPFYELMHRASMVHRMYWNPAEVQQCTLLSIKTGGCTEDCKYCSQSTRYKTFVKPTPTMKVQEVLQAAQRAKDAGSTRFCMGAAWRELGNKQNAFGHILEMVKGVNAMGLEVCCTLGMLTAEQARQLKQAGLTAYNHNLDTSPEHYPNVITTRSYEDRLQTIANVRDAGISVCCGGILGLGEKETDRVGLLHVLATLPEHPESVPINALVAVQGTPLGDQQQEEDDDAMKSVDVFDMARMIATARIVMPRTMVRLSAGRLSFSDAEQFLMFQAGANSIFNGDKLLTTSNPEFDADQALFRKLGFQGKPAHQGPLVAPAEADGHVIVTHVRAEAQLA
ncbi:biotin synthase [Fistulifera solaris]|uniref:biotin synthase n=1 Tax=Fistulifera solaris TaxID=1519565 RepID=A0A1Z5K592_FISSO|nr:biotin synthase [Fistulifera solaris]|eukprot:GAX21365.1 biotin synthase [Fistulifera solaris]